MIRFCLYWSQKRLRCRLHMGKTTENELINTLLLHGKSIHKIFHEKNPAKGTQKLIITTTGRTELFV